MEKIFNSRREKIYSYLEENKINLAVFEDSEDKRDCALRYLCGHPNDATLILSSSGKSYLFPWDENLSKKYAHADYIFSYNEFGRNKTDAINHVINLEKISENACIDFSPSTTYLDFKKIKSDLKNYSVFCRNNSVHDYLVDLRAVKDEYEINCTRQACRISNQIVDEIIYKLKSGLIKTELDVALFIEKLLRENNCERTSFDTLAAGPNRSYGIHAFPGYTNSPWGSKGLSILDFGVCYEGYASDLTITIARDVSKEQDELLTYVEKAYNECLNLYKAGNFLKEAFNHAQEIFSKIERKMPHGLGHGIGLEIHENPFVSSKASDDKTFKEGNIITLEPGLYDIDLGGVRLENDILITKESYEVLSNSKIYRL